MKNQYVILTGSKNNAGDYLIKYRAKQLFESIRKDRKIIDYNGWKVFNKEQLDEVNLSKALILLGGPSLQNRMYPKVYGLTDNIDDIKVPIVTMGIGWYSKKGNWTNTYDYKLDEKSLNLLDRINKSGYQSSVRDFHTLNALQFKGFDNFIMTGCPAYYDLNKIEKGFRNRDIKRVAFSLGVSFVDSLSQEKLIKENILMVKERFSKEIFEVVFHHSLDENKFGASYKGLSKHLKKHQAMASWLKTNGISYVDISGSAENLMEYYSDVDFHVGYRVHAHIFMNSISKYSILISEDGRAKATEKVIGGIVLDSYSKYNDGLILKAINKSAVSVNQYVSNANLTKEIDLNINYELQTRFNRMRNSRSQIDNNFVLMEKYLKQLP